MRGILFLLCFAPILLRAYVLDPNLGQSEFLAMGRPAAIKILGKGAGPAGDFQIKKEGEDYLLNGEAQLDLNSLSTGIELRDRHMKEKYLKIDTNKQAIVKLTKVKVPTEKISKGGEVRVLGILVLNKVEKPIEIILNIAKENSFLQIKSEFKIRLSDFSIDIPSYAGMTVADSVDLKIVTKVDESAFLEKKP